MLQKCDDNLGEGLSDEFILNQIPESRQRDERISTTRKQKETIQYELRVIHNAEIMRFAQDRAIADDLYGDTCHRGLFDVTRTSQTRRWVISR